MYITLISTIVIIELLVVCIPPLIYYRYYKIGLEDNYSVEYSNGAKESNGVKESTVVE